jgi:hypothetical protein
LREPDFGRSRDVDLTLVIFEDGLEDVGDRVLVFHHEDAAAIHRRPFHPTA